MKQRRRANEQIDADLYSTSILEELLDSTGQWRGVEDIVKLSFKAVSDILQTHAQSLKDLKAVVTTRASKTELNTGLSLKCNISDISSTVEQLSHAIQEKATYAEINTILRDFATRADLNEVLAERQHERLPRVVQEKENVEVTILKTRMDEFQKEITKRVGACVTIGQHQQLLAILENKANINEINEALESKISKQYFTTALQKKVSKNEMDSCLAKKADTADLDYVVNSLQSKVNVSTLDKLTQVIQNKADKSDLLAMANDRSSHNRSQQRLIEQEWVQRMDQMRNSLTMDIKNMKKQIDMQIRDIDNKFIINQKKFDHDLQNNFAAMDIELVKKQSKHIYELQQQFHPQIESLRQNFTRFQEEQSKAAKAVNDRINQVKIHKRSEENIYAEIDAVRKKIEEYACKAVEKTEFIDFKSEMMERIQNKVEIDEMQTGLDKFQSQVNSKMASDKADYLQLLKNLQNHLNESLSITNSQAVELRKALTKKQDKNDSTNIEQSLRKFRKEVEDCRKTVDIAYNQIHSKISVKEYETDLIEIRKRFELLSKQVALKANIKDVCVLSDSKPNIDDVNNALKQINDALADKITEADLQSILKDQATINETLCSENIVGRWTWQSGQLKAGGLIPWEGESANTVPDHFFWEKDKTSILIIAAGIYEVTTSVFSKGSLLTLMANGQIVYSSKGQQNVNNINRRVRKRKDKQLGSTSVREYLMLPSRSRISVSCGGQVADGFLNIRRL